LSTYNDSEPFQNFMEFLIYADSSTFRAYVLADLLIKSKCDLSNLVGVIFKDTWEYRIIEPVLRSGPLNQSQLSRVLFGNIGKEYILSRQSDTKFALDRLVDRSILTSVKEGRNNYFCINPKMKPMVGILFMH